MKTKRVADGVCRVGLHGVNAFLIEADDGLVLVDAGLRSSPPRITEAIYSLGRLPQDVRGIIITHVHRDHVGGLAEMKRRTGADIWMHPADAALVREGRQGRPLKARPNAVSRAIVGIVSRLPERLGQPLEVAHEVVDGEELPFAGLRAVHTPGHTEGHLSLLLPRDGGVLFVGDALNNWFRLSLGSLHEDEPGSRASLHKLAGLHFEVACFAHGRTIESGAQAAVAELDSRIAAS